MKPKTTALHPMHAARKGCGLSQEQLADLAGVTQSLVSRIEASKIVPGRSAALKLWKALRKQVPLSVPLGDFEDAASGAPGPAGSFSCGIEQGIEVHHKFLAFTKHRAGGYNWRPLKLHQWVKRWPLAP